MGDTLIEQGIRASAGTAEKASRLPERRDVIVAPQASQRPVSSERIAKIDPLQLLDEMANDPRYTDEQFIALCYDLDLTLDPKKVSKEVWSALRKRESISDNIGEFYRLFKLTLKAHPKEAEAILTYMVNVTKNGEYFQRWRENDPNRTYRDAYGVERRFSGFTNINYSTSYGFNAVEEQEASGEIIDKTKEMINKYFNEIIIGVLKTNDPIGTTSTEKEQAPEELGPDQSGSAVTEPENDVSASSGMDVQAGCAEPNVAGNGKSPGIFDKLINYQIKSMTKF